MRAPSGDSGAGRSPGSDTARSSPRSAALVCPHCRASADGGTRDEPAGGGLRLAEPIPRCPRDGYAFVAPEVLARSDGDPFLGMTIADRFVVVGKLGAGSMGTVYRARQEAVGRDVAIKILRTDRALDATAKTRFGREARALSLLSSPHTVTVFDFGEVADPTADELAPVELSLFLVMELLEGESLGDRLRLRERLSVADATLVARQVLLSLSEAHEKGIIHRDLKPDNIFLARAPEGSFGRGGEIVKVLDFGIAKVSLASRGVDALETQAGTVFGTPRYMSPEQAQGKDLDARSDLYTLGVLLYHMLVGRAPFVDEDAVVVMARHIKTPPVPPIDAAPSAGIGPALSALVVRALSKDPDDRPPSAKAFLTELDAALRPEEDSGVRRAANASGELGAVVHDGVHDGFGAPLTSRRDRGLSRIRAGLVAMTSAAVVSAAGLFALGAMRTDRVALAHGEIAHLVAARRLAMMQARAVSDTPSAQPQAPAPEAPASGTPSASPDDGPAPATNALPVNRRRVRRYRKFEP